MGRSVRSSLRFLVVACAFLIVGSAAQAQITTVTDDTSTPIEGAGHDYIKMLSETVNPANGSVSLRIQVPTPKGRGVTIPFSFSYDSNSVHHLIPYSIYGQAIWTSNIGYLSQGGWNYSVPMASASETDQTAGTYPNFYTCVVTTNYTFTDASGGQHALGMGTQSSGGGNCNNAPISSGGDPQILASIPATVQNPGPNTPTVFTGDGTVYRFTSFGHGIPTSSQQYALVSSIEDRNGNIVTATDNGGGSFSFKDTAGRTLISSNGFGPSGTTNTVSFSGLIYQVAWKTVSASFSTSTPTWTGPANEPSQYDNCTPPPSANDSQTVISKITLPNGQSYTFYYGTDVAPHATATNPYGLLSEIDYPSGGWVTYSWKLSDTPNELADYPGYYNAGASTCSTDPNAICPVPVADGCLYLYAGPVVASRSVGFSESSSPSMTQAFTYSTTWAGAPSALWTAKSTKVTSTDSVSGKSSLTSYSYSPVPAPLPAYSYSGFELIPVESATSVYDWGNTTTPIRTHVKTWYNPFDLATDTTKELAQSSTLMSEVVYCYAGTSCAPNAFSQLKSKSEYGFGRGVVGSLLRQTVTTYQAFSGTPGYIADAPCQVVTYDGNNNRYAETDYLYDGGSTLCGTIASSAATTAVTVVSGTHDESTFGPTKTTPRGNVTKKAQWSSTGTAPATTYAYDETGQVLAKTDPCGNGTCADMAGSTHTTNYYYADSYTTGSSTCTAANGPQGNTNALLTKVVYPATNGVAHSECFSYDFNSGQLTGLKDQNSQLTTYAYSDPFLRPTQASYPDGGQTTISYSDTAPSPSVTTTKLISSGLNLGTTTETDGMGHVVQNQVTTDPQGTDSVDTSYDGMGRVISVSNPQRSSTSSTDGTTLNTYDGLGRTTLIQRPDGSSVQTAYDQTCPTNTGSLGTLVTDEAGNQRRSCSDGLGRLVEVDEPGQSGTHSATSATGTFTISGAEQSKQTSPPTSGFGAIMISGSEQSQGAISGLAGGSLGQYGPLQCTKDQYGQYIPAMGTISVTIYGPQTGTGSTSWGGLCDQYGDFTLQPPGGINQIATNLASSISFSGAGVTGFSSGESVTITANAAGSGTNYALSPNWTSTGPGGFSAEFPSSLTGGSNAKQDTGSVSVIVDGYTVSATYGSSSTASSVAASLVTGFTNTNSPVSPSGTNPLTLTSKATGTASNYSGTTKSSSTNGFSPTSFSGAPSSFTFTGGTNAGYTYDTGTVSVTVGTFTATVNYVSTDTPTSVADNLAAYFNSHVSSGSPVTASASGATVTLTTTATGIQVNYSYSGTSSTSQSGLFSSPSFSVSTQGSNMGGGANSSPAWSLGTPNVTLYTYDPLNNLTCAVQKGTDTTAFSTCGSASVNWRPRAFGYDSLSRLTSASNPETGTISYTYDLNSNLSSKTAPKPNPNNTGTVTTNYSYDVLNRIIGKSYLGLTTSSVLFAYDGSTLTSGCGQNPPSITATYTVGRRSAMCGQASGSSWSFDSMGRPLVESTTNLGSAAKTLNINYTYNQDGSLKTLTYPSGDVVTYTTGAAGRTTQVTDSANNFVTSATYAPPGLLAGMTNGSGIVTSNVYNDRLQPVLFSAGVTGQSSIFSLCYDFHSHNAINTSPCNLPAYTTGDNGNVYQVLNNVDATRSAVYAYDGLNRIEQANTINVTSTNPNCWGEVYTVDPWGNMYGRGGPSGMASNCVTETLSANATTNNQLGGIGMLYDLAGNVINDGNGNIPLYDAENRMATDAGFSYYYDAEGSRMEKSAGSSGTMYWGALAETDLTGTVNEEYIFFNGERIARVDRPSGAVHYYFSDKLDSASVIASSTGAVQARYVYYPYGGMESSTGSDSNHYKFTGKERDTESNLDEFGARYYTSTDGRFMTPDWAARPTSVPYAVFGDPQSLNLYTYVRNDPVSDADADGHVDNTADCKDTGGGTCMKKKEGCKYSACVTASMPPGPDPVRMQRLMRDSIMRGYTAPIVTGALHVLRHPFVGAVLMLEAADGGGALDDAVEDAAEEAGEEGASSSYKDITTEGSVKNIETDITPDQFGRNLEANGFTKAMSKDGSVANYVKGDLKFSVYSKASSTGGPSAQVFKGATTIEKIRFK